jgi:outer membrane protein assembly factor BamB
LTSSGVLVNGALYASGCMRTKSLHCLDWKTGQELAVMKLATANSAYASVAMVWADGRLYCQVQDGTVALLKPQPSGFEVTGRFQLVDARNGDAGRIRFLSMAGSICATTRPSGVTMSADESE